MIVSGDEGGAMSITVWLAASTLGYPRGGGHLWVYLNWALGLQALGCRVVWLEAVDPQTPVHGVEALTLVLMFRLERFCLLACLALYSRNGEPPPRTSAERCLDLQAGCRAGL